MVFSFIAKKPQNSLPFNVIKVVFGTEHSQCVCVEQVNKCLIFSFRASNTMYTNTVPFQLVNYSVI